MRLIKLRLYQSTLKGNGKQAFIDGHKRIIMQTPTGGGKTVVFTSILHDAHVKKNDALLLTDRKELFGQAKKTLNIGGVPVSTIDASSPHMPTKGIVVSMAQTLVRRLAKCGFNPKLIIVDEAHIGTFTRILEHFPNAHVMGFTATPMGKHIPKLYTKIVQGPQVKELIALGNLCRARSYQMIDEVGSMRTQNGDFHNSDLFTFYDKPTLYSGVKKTWLERGNMRPTILFCVNIEHAEKTANSFGVYYKDKSSTAFYPYARSITSNTKKEDRDRILKDHKSGVFPILVNCGILTTGFDAPYLELVITNRATKSLPLWLQMCGRGGRPTETKKEFEIWDFGGNFTRHGLWQADRDWKLDKHREKHTLGASPVRKCVCGAMLDANAKECPYCGHVFPVPVAVPKFGVLQEVLEQRGKKISECSVSELVELEKEGRFKPHFVWRVLRSKGESALIEYSEKKGYSFGWVLRQLKENCNYKDVLV